MTTYDLPMVTVYSIGEPTLDPVYPAGDDYQPVVTSDQINLAIRRTLEANFKYYLLVPDPEGIKMKEFDNQEELENYLENKLVSLSPDQAFIFYGQNLSFRRRVEIEPHFVEK
jgi:hypothetical protein